MDLVYSMVRELRRRHYSERTVKTYSWCVARFLHRIRKEPRSVTKHDIKEYLTILAERGVSASTLNVHLQALKFAFDNLLGKRLYIRLPCSKTGERLPEVLTQDEVVRLFAAIRNERQRLMVSLLYAAGLRVSELVQLRVRDLDIENRVGWVRHGKGDKDRPFIIAERLIEDLQRLVAAKTLDSWLFPGWNGNHYSARSIAAVLERASHDAGIWKNVHPHTMRHSFATHLLENGAGVAELQGLLGHASAETTMVYVHLTQPKLLASTSPLDALDVPQSSFPMYGPSRAYPSFS